MLGNVVYAVLLTTKRFTGFDPGPTYAIFAANYADIITEVEGPEAVNSDLLNAAAAAGVAAVDPANLGAYNNITAVAPVYADLAAAQTSVNAVATEIDANVQIVHEKLNDLMTTLRTAGIIA